MAITYPATLDTAVGAGPASANRGSTATNDVTFAHGASHADLSAAVVALETKVGITSSADVNSHEYKMWLTPDLGVNCFDDFLGSANTFALNWNAAGNGVAPTAASIVGVSSAAKASGVVDMPGGTTATTSRSELILGGPGTAGSNTAFVPRLGILSLTWRVWIPVLHTASDYTTLRIGMFSDDGTGAPQDGLWFSYVRATSVNWITNTMAATVTTATTSSTALTAAAWHKCSITTDATWANITFAVDGVTLATMTTNIPANTKVTPIRFQSFKTLGATNQIASADSMSMRYVYAR